MVVGEVAVSGSRRVRRLVRRIHDVQRAEGLTLDDMALRLGVSQSMLGMVYAGKRNPGRKFLAGLLKAYPRLREEVHLFLLNSPRDGE